MKDRSQIVMIAGLVILFLTVLQLTTSGANFGFWRMSGALPWIMLGLGFWLFYGKCGESCSSKKGTDD